jgi:cation diffusion facilitator family transporter
MAHHDATSHILASLRANLIICVSKLVAAFWTGSGAMLAEGIHTGADSVNQLLLLRGVSESRIPADAEHPLGHGRTAYFWSFMVAIFMFLGGGVFSVYEGIEHLYHPEPIQYLWVAIAILGGSLLLEGWATYDNIREFNRRRGSQGFFQYLQQTKDCDLVVVFGENAASVLGLLLAITAIVLAKITGDPRFDAAGTLLVGLVLIGVAAFLALEIKSLLTGEAADPGVLAALKECVAEDPRLSSLLNCVALQQGPGEVLVAAKVRLQDTLHGPQIVEAINALEKRLKAKRGDVKWLFIEPDVVA